MLVALGWLTLAASVGIGVWLRRGLASMPALGDTRPADDGATVTIVVAARNEAATLGPAIPTLLDQDHPVEVIVVNDRSTDGTGALLDALAARHARLRVLHLDALPDGWLGKNHALQRGAELATSELILFTDADVVMDRSAAGRAVALMRDLGVDHLAVAPRLRAGSGWSAVVVAVFLALFSVLFRPWKAADPRSRAHIGIGAFNLVRAAAYRAVGGHRRIALRPDDDVRLGRLLKRAGFRQAAATGRERLEVQWYASLPEMTRGLRKNAFAAVEYRLGAVLAATLVPVVFVFWPVAALVVTDGAVRWLNAGTLAAGMATIAMVARGHDLPIRVALAYPVGSALLTWIVWSATLTALRTGTIEWRGTHYPLDRLRAAARAANAPPAGSEEE